MGLMDKAKKMAEQAQTKLDEVQKQFNEGGSTAPPAGPAVEYDQHGRPVGPPVGGSESATPPHGDPVSQPAPPPAPHGDPVAEPSPPPVPPAAPPAAPVPDPAAPASEEEDPNRPSYAPPKLSGGDPLAG